MLKKLGKILIIVVVFVLIFNELSRLYQRRFPNPYKRNVQYAKLDDPDVVFIGTSELMLGAVPVILYEEEGITSYNLANNWKSSLTYYYTLKYALKKHHPKVVVCDFDTLFAGIRPQDKESVFRQGLYAMPDRQIKREMLLDIMKTDPQEALLYAFPIFRFHSMWSTDYPDFSREASYDEIEPDFKLGWYTHSELVNRKIKSDSIDLSEKNWAIGDSEQEIPDYDRAYYDKIVSLCKENDAKLVAVMAPSYAMAASRVEHLKKMQEYLDENDIPFLNYNTYESCQRLHLDWNSEFWDDSHLNRVGGADWSRYLAADLKQVADLPDHRNDDTDFSRQMDAWVDEFYQKYQGEIPRKS